jgi:acyl-coenzyme A synthetase/AMP-(fatty) acid ligase
VPLLELMQNHRITHLFIVPTIAVGLAKAPLVANYDLTSLRYILSGAAPLDGAVQQALSDRLKAPVVQGYGMTEVSLAIAVVPEEQPKVGAAVIPSPDAEAGEVPKAFVVLKESCTPDEIMTFVAERVAPHKKVRQIAIVEAIPKSPTGKILRRLLVEQDRSIKVSS